MAVIHHTTLVPTKLELLTAWLPQQPWYRGSSAPVLVKSGGFRLDDPAGEVGIEFYVTTDTCGVQPVSYHVPMTYRGAPLASGALIGTLDHGVLGKRWVYEGMSDPVLLAQVTELFVGRAAAQMQSSSNTPDRDVDVELCSAGTGFSVRVNRIPLDGESATDRCGRVSVPWETPQGTRVSGVVLEAVAAA